MTPADAKIVRDRQEADILEHLRTTDFDAFKARLAELHAHGHTIADIWRMVIQNHSCSYSSVRTWIAEGRADLTHQKHRLEALPNAHASVRPPFSYTPASRRIVKGRVWVQIPKDEQEPFRNLAKRVSQLRGTTPPDSPLWAAREAFEQAIWTYYERGVRISDMARVAGVTHRAIAFRVRRRDMTRK